MMFLSLAARIFATLKSQSFRNWEKNAVKLQKKTFLRLIKQGRSTDFGREHNFDRIVDHASFVNNVPVRDYESYKPYIDRIIQGEKGVLWPGRPKYFAKTSGTTSGAKHIPITKVWERLMSLNGTTIDSIQPSLGSLDR